MNDAIGKQLSGREPSPGTGRDAASLRSVASMAGVSVATASRVLSGTRKVDLSIAARVEAAARQLNYSGNYHHRSIRTGRAQAIGFALETPRSGRMSPLSGYFAAIISGLDAGASDEGYALTMFGPNQGQCATEAGLQAVRTRRVDALVVAGELHSPGSLLRLQNSRSMPLVMTHPRFRAPAASVSYDDVAGMTLVIAHLAGLGHRRILWLGPASYPASDYQTREQHFITAVWDAGLEGMSCRYDVPTQLTHKHEPAPEETIVAETALRGRLNQAAPDFTAIVAYNDFAAVGALRALAAAGLTVPRDVSVTGFDNMIATITMPALTSVDLRFFDLGREAASLAVALSRRATSPDESTRQIPDPEDNRVIPPKLHVRSSTGPVR
jgi:LacI family transcriptional regulator